MTRHASAGWAALGALCLVGCAHHQTAPVRELSDEALQALTEAPSYEERISRDQQLAELATAVVDALPARSVEGSYRDAALDALAHAAAITQVDTGQPPAWRLQQLMAWHVGQTAIPLMTIFTSRSKPTFWLQDVIRQFVQGIGLPEGTPVAFGLAQVWRMTTDEAAVVVAVRVRNLVLAPIPRAVVSGQPLSFRGRALSAARERVLLVEDAEGAVRRIPVDVGRDGTFAVSFEAPQASGRRFIELLALRRGPGGKGWVWQPELALPLSVNVPPALPALAPATAPLAPLEWAKTFTERINAFRARHGLEPIALHPGAALLAQSHLERHERTETFEPGEKTQQALSDLGFRRSSFVDLAEFESLDDYFDALLESPSFRTAALRPTEVLGLSAAPCERHPRRVVFSLVLVDGARDTDPGS